jgi:hypothetical protein
MFSPPGGFDYVVPMIPLSILFSTIGKWGDPQSFAALVRFNA